LLGGGRPDGTWRVGSGILDRRHSWDRRWADRQPGLPALGIPEVRGFPQLCADRASCRGFWLDNTEEVRLDKYALDVDTAETLAASCVYSDRQQSSLGLPQIAQVLERLDSSPPWAST